MNENAGDSIREQAYLAAHELCECAGLKKGQIMVIGCSTSEVVGSRIGTNSDVDVALELFTGIKTALDEVGVYGEVRRQLARRHHGVVGYYHVARAVVEDADYAAVVHRTACQVAHALSGAFAVEIATLQRRQRNSYLLHFADCRHLLHLVVGEFRHVHGDVTSVALGPSVLPQIAGNFCYFLHFGAQSGASFQYTFHNLFCIICF